MGFISLQSLVVSNILFLEDRNQGDLIEAFKIFSRFTEIDYRKFFGFQDNGRSLRGHSKIIIKHHKKDARFFIASLRESLKTGMNLYIKQFVQEEFRNVNTS